jgi:hypothetical protein
MGVERSPIRLSFLARAGLKSVSIRAEGELHCLGPMTYFLYDRIVRDGTLSEPEGVPDPQFALPSTVNWMRALGLLVSHTNIKSASAQRFYASVPKRAFTSHEENTIFEQLFFSLHQLSALEAFRSLIPRADIARVAIVTWYYGVYYAASGMVAAQDGSFRDSHAGTGNSWDRHVAARGMAMPPFGLRVSTLVESDTKTEIAGLRRGSTADLKSPALTSDDALGACCSYLSGTAGWYRWRATEELRGSKEFKALGVADFRSKAARELRNARLSTRAVGFMQQAIRYRGKANYREALFLGYGTSVETLVSNYVNDMAIVLAGFVTMAGSFASKRLGPQLWGEFVADVERHRAFSISPREVWG